MWSERMVGADVGTVRRGDGQCSQCMVSASSRLPSEAFVSRDRRAGISFCPFGGSQEREAQGI